LGNGLDDIQARKTTTEKAVGKTRGKKENRGVRE